LAVALVAPLDVAVFGLLVVGVVHVVFELRYVVGRFPGIARGDGAIVVQAALAVLVVLRIASGVSWAPRAEIVVWAGLVACAGIVVGGRRGAPVVVGATIGVAALAWADPATWLVLLAQGHNVVPALFVWDWSRTHASGRARTAVRAVTLGWIAVVPTLLLTGVLASGRLGPGAAARIGPAGRALDAATPPALRAGTLPPRFLAVFAFAQLVHYGVWCWWLPRHAPDVTASFATTAPGRWLRGWRIALVAAIGTGVVLAGATTSYANGRTVYTAFAAYHAYLEFPVLVALLAGWAKGGFRAHLARTALAAG
jgi:hypothetical protein